MLLRRSADRSHRRAPGHGILPLPFMPLLVGRTRQCLLALESRCRKGHRGCREYRDVLEDPDERAKILQQVRRPCDGQSSTAENGRCVRGDHSDSEFPSRRTRQLRRDGPADQGWADQVQGLSIRFWWLRRNGLGLRAWTARRQDAGTGREVTSPGSSASTDRPRTAASRSRARR
jgi:hypothetical protein